MDLGRDQGDRIIAFVGAALGKRADWYQNILADPKIEVRVKARRFRGIAEPITDPSRIADFLDLRIRRHPKMVGAMLKLEGLPNKPSRTQLEQYAAKLTLVAIHPTSQAD
ncbi:MAG: nitroreductase family deazaflavin-dependent oxidoreductase [Chloroflexi bacterium]|nr:nitroreductase family deazaflavin-dependent oxidoreductase [Chloroflexota bacterium]